MGLEAGTNLGPYEILGPIGAGGMGEVYRARDTRLDRTVAVKVLPQHLAQDVNARQRLEREARAVSSLSHPHICTLYDVGQQEGVYYLVVEYLEGETLSDRLERGALPVQELLTYAIQIADALDKAHRQGLIHRDLKPGNVMLTPTGAKLLDFGLAKSVPKTSSATDLTAPVTATSPLTAEGTIVGTFQYLAPEQLEGQEADARSDIFAFGVVLYEMATGRRAFEGKTQASLIAAILEREPPSVASVQPLAPPALDRLIRTCLSKNADERRQSMHDVLLDLRWIAEAGSQAGIPAPITHKRKTRARLAWALVAALGALSAVLLYLQLTRTVVEPPTVLSYVPPAEGTQLTMFPGGNLAISPDGSTLAYVAFDEERYVWLRPLDSTGSRKLTGTAGARLPFWSPDGKSIGFFADGKLKRVDAVGGSAMTLCDASFGMGGSWGTNDVIVFAPQTSSGIFRVSAAGGEPVAVTGSDLPADADGEAEAPDRQHWAPSLLPDGKHFLYLASEQEADSEEYVGTLRVGSIDGSLDKIVLRVNSNAAYIDGHIVYARTGTLLAQPFDLDALEAVGDPTIIAEPVDQFYGKAHFAAGGNLLAFVEQGTETGGQLTWYDRDGRTIGTIDSPEPLDDISLSVSERYLAVARDDPDDGGGIDIWTVDLRRDVFTRVTFEGNADDPVFSPDGDWITYASQGNLHRKRSNGAGEPERLTEFDFDEVTQEWSPDGAHILFLKNTGKGEDIWALPIGESGPGEAFAVLASPFREIHADLSPDGRWLAYTSDEAGEPEVFVMGWPDLRGKWKVSPAGGSMPRWRGDGREMYYMSPDRQIMAVEIEPDPDDFGIGQPRALFSTRLDRPFSIRTHQYVATRDGERFLVIEPPITAEDAGILITLISNPF